MRRPEGRNGNDRKNGTDANTLPELHVFHVSSKFSRMTLGDCIALGTALIALFAALVSIWQTRYTTRVQALLQLDGTWSGASMCGARKRAAASLLNGDPTADVDRVLDFFETMAGIFLKHRVIPEEWARHTFYWGAVCYWLKAKSYMNEVRANPAESEAWKDFCELMLKWAQKESLPEEGLVRAFMEDEADLVS